MRSYRQPRPTPTPRPPTRRDLIAAGYRELPSGLPEVQRTTTLPSAGELFLLVAATFAAVASWAVAFALWAYQ